MAAGEGVDRISNLPGSIHHHILSFLDTKSAVQTCVLSKQWESAWKHVQSLNLQNVYFNEYSRYEKFVDKVLFLRHPVPVSTVSIGPIGCEFSLLKRVVQYALSHGAQHFNIRPINRIAPDISLVKLFDNICDTVTTLQLGWLHLNFQSDWSAFRSLTMLKLYGTRFSVSEDGELFEPFSQLPCLSDLVLNSCLWKRVSEGFMANDETVRLRVSGLELVNLTLSDINVCKLEIFAPKLESFGLYLDKYMEFSELTVPSLVHADIRSSYWRSMYERYDIDIESLVSMFHGLHNVESLSLRGDICNVVDRTSKFLEQHPCPFTKLKKLNIEFRSNYSIPHEVLEDYFLNGSSDASLNIQILEEEDEYWGDRYYLNSYDMVLLLGVELISLQ